MVHWLISMTSCLFWCIWYNSIGWITNIKHVEQPTDLNTVNSVIDNAIYKDVVRM